MSNSLLGTVFEDMGAAPPPGKKKKEQLSESLL